jgi:hypothetical protein
VGLACLEIDGIQIELGRSPTCSVGEKAGSGAVGGAKSTAHTLVSVVG